jgi:hypothetical protein
LKIHVAVDIKSKKIFFMTATNEHAHNSKVLPELVNYVLKSNSMTIICKLFGDGAYDSNDIFRCISDNGIHLCIY